MVELGPDGTVDWHAELVDQLEFHWQHALWPGLAGLTDDEYRWEPVDGMASIRPRADANRDWRAFGAGDVVVEYPPEAHPSPHLTTIAWRMAHLTVDIFAQRTTQHADDASHDRDAFTWKGTAADGLAQLQHWHDRWVAFVRGLSEERMASPVGAHEGPFATHPYAALVLHCTREVLHHGAEIRLLRDLYRQRATLG